MAPGSVASEALVALLTPVAKAFYDYIGTPAAQEIMVRYGFAMPKE